VKAPPEACAACGAPAAPDQEYCLDCGARILPPKPPGNWIWASTLLLLVAAGSATAGIVAADDSGTRQSSKTIVATSAVVPAPPSPPAQTTTAPAARAPVPPPPRPSAPKQGRALIEWPAGDGFTVVLASVPARGSGRQDAEATAKEAIAKGLREVGVLVSSRFASLHPDYFVVFAGVYDSLEDAETAVARVSSRFPNAYARQITR
jgi:hypothetical protein